MTQTVEFTGISEHAKNAQNSENTVPADLSKDQANLAKAEVKEQRTAAPLRPSPNNQVKRSFKRLGKYQFSMEQKIGSGMSGDVYVGIDTQTLQIICVKVIDRAVYKTPEQKKLLENEIRCQSACISEFSIRILDVFDTASFCFIITEFCEGGDLYRLLKSSPNGLPESLVSKLGLQLAQALSSLKAARIVHRDFKSQNILMTKGQCRLGDFGFAIEEGRLSEHKFNLGSPLYMSPQALERSEYSFASDVFAFGVVLFEMIHKESPWECSEEFQLIAKMKTEQPSIKSPISEPMKQLILDCLKRNPAERPSIEQVLSHKALKQLPETPL